MSPAIGVVDFTMSFLVRNKEPVKAIIKKNVDFLLEIFVL